VTVVDAAAVFNIGAIRIDLKVAVARLFLERRRVWTRAWAVGTAAILFADCRVALEASA
jgi:hypothetical protein